MAVSRSWTGGMVGFHTDYWLISPKVNIPDAESVTLTFWAQSEGGTPPEVYLDRIEIWTSTTGITTGGTGLLAEGEPGLVLGDFTFVMGEKAPGGAWHQFTVNMTHLSGTQAHIAFRHKDFDNSFLLLDEIRMTYTPAEEVEEVPNKVTLLTPEDDAEDVDRNITFTWSLDTEIEIDGLRLYITEDIEDWGVAIALDADAEEYTVEEALDFETTYYWRVIAYNEVGDSEYDVFSFTTEEDVSEGEETVLIVTGLSGNFPNPFNPETTIRFGMAEAGNVNISIYNIRGQRVNTLVNGHLDRGNHSITWNGTSDDGRSLSSGVYFYLMRTDNYTESRRMILLK